MMNRFGFSSKWIIVSFLLTILLHGFTAFAAGLTVEHNLEVDLFPDEKKLVGIDNMEVQTDDSATLTFLLSERTDRIEVKVNDKPSRFQRQNHMLRIPLSPAERNGTIRVTIRYNGIFDDPVPIRPVNQDNPGFGVSATITATGSFFLAGSYWYPELAQSRSIYSLIVRAPTGMIAVTAGRLLGHKTESGRSVSEWRVDYPIEGLSLSVAPFFVQEKKVGNITAATYLLEADPKLSTSYLEATAKYLLLYSNLFGSYPFEKFAVVENFFPTGFGFPSYTLLGGMVLRLPFIIDTSLGHEIAHCWWGNGVYVDYDKGNWSEALTTYVADYLYKEMQSKEAAVEYRLQILRNYATLVKPQNDFALSRFVSRRDPITKTIGYDKGAMIFHMLRQLLGEEAFWGALRDIFRQRLFQRTSWQDLQRAFEHRAERSLQVFFEQWVYQKGAPRFYLNAVTSDHSMGRWKVRGHVVQQKPYFNFDLKLTLRSGSQKNTKTVSVTANSTFFEVISEGPPDELILDPYYDIMRQLYDAEIPPSINSLKSSKSVLFLLSDNVDPAVKEAAGILALSFGLNGYKFISESAVTQTQLHEHDILMIGYPKQKELLRNLSHKVAIKNGSFSLNGKLYNESSDAFFGVFAHPFDSSRVAALYWPLSPQYAGTVAGKLTHYGKYSYLAFQSGQNQDKGFWQVEDSPLVYRWNHEGR